MNTIYKAVLPSESNILTINLEENIEQYDIKTLIAMIKTIDGKIYSIPYEENDNNITIEFNNNAFIIINTIERFKGAEVTITITFN